MAPIKRADGHSGWYTVWKKNTLSIPATLLYVDVGSYEE